ncbi:acetyl-CoA carboxylase biotin carboxyl carrier protein [Blastopirellula sp. JC732]|uniref:Biotin carboxyl carrier protein of acetyl-CoA carboxylase n=1 Tax=Blastopirellula sediminis TaxID=2894196 RepID=A0A9X1MQY4_9BACT|nr:acetyl-CoA carboxylase biotin carboxyl carrier protein [Blastopirellula sediminis]MCC9604823.1 acetyl-CoA carboxylase biotin carboxyl carrier protein [Blastopirellula sediminis]MCC9631878.1 acetyl-CoA carboxylase biotin carboxyl carrier protein [Blastopirellula sediminis]
MAKSEPATGGVFDLDRLRQLIELMKEHELSEIDLREGEKQIQMKRGSAVAYAPAPMPVAAAPAPVASSAAAPSAAAEDSHLVTINSPMVGTFYAKPKPDSENFAKVGDHIGEESVVCIIEAMKVFNEIKAEMTGKIVAVLAKNEDPVEYGQPLFKVDPRG